MYFLLLLGILSFNGYWSCIECTRQNVPRQTGTGATAPKIPIGDRVHEVDIGSRLVLNCSATGSPQPVLSWTKRQANSFTTVITIPRSVTQRNTNQGRQLVFSDISMSDKGTYVCEATNKAGTDRMVSYVDVSTIDRSFYLPPRVVPVHQVVTVGKGSTAKLVCSAKNTPQPLTVPFWNHNGNEITNTARLNTQERYSESIAEQKYKDQNLEMSLTISHVTSKDVGRYTCGVVTRVGRQEDHVELKIKA